MKRLCFIFILTMLCVGTTWGNNVRIIGNVSVEDKDVDNATQIATVKIKIGWDNSWRDAFNYDAVYIFLKYKVDGVDELWHHAYLMNTGHKVTSGFDYLLSNATGGQNLNQGMFIFRKDKGFGNAEVDLELKWLITSNADRPLKPGTVHFGKRVPVCYGNRNGVCSPRSFPGRRYQIDLYIWK